MTCFFSPQPALWFSTTNVAMPAANVVLERSQVFSSCETEILTSASGAEHAENESAIAATLITDKALLLSNVFFFLDCKGHRNASS